MSVALLVMTDGRDDVLERCLSQPPVRGAVELVREWWIHDDTGDDVHRMELARRHPSYTQLGSGPRRGFGGAIHHAWRELCTRSRATYVLHLEDDFLFGPDVDLYAMVAILARHEHLQQVALQRQPWNTRERAAGGIVAADPDDFTEVRDGGHVWLEHRRFFTTNPSVYRRTLCARGWPTGQHSEGHFGIGLFAEDPAFRSAYLGGRHTPPMVEHIGRDRVGVGY